MVLCLVAATFPDVPPEVQSQLEKAYQKAVLAASYKYVDGMLSLRGPNFQLFTPTGSTIDLTSENQRFYQLFQKATRIRLTTKMLTIRPKSPDYICSVVHKLELEGVNLKARKLTTMIIDTTAQDLWSEYPQGWRMRASQVTRQTISEGGRIQPAEKVRPW
jgi:hypothetical protein